MRKEVEFKSVVAAAILKLGKLDNVDISMILEDLERLSIDVTDCYYLGEARRFVEIQEDGSITLSGTITLDDFIDERDITVEDELQKMVTENIKEYFDKLDVEEFKRRKLEFLKSGKEKLLKNVNILLISDIEEEYQELVKYGFSHIDYFKSIIRADSYFKKHPEEAKKYDILIDGSEKVVDEVFDRNRFLETIRESNNVLAITLNRYDYPDYFELTAYLVDINNHRYWTSTKRGYREMFEEIAECAVLNKVSDKVKENEFIPIKDKINPNRVPLPTKKEELKILYLDACSINPEAEILARRLGLDVTFLVDNNSTLKESARYELGNYDIIIASALYSRKLLSLNKESTEQCKDTGRQVVLLLTYKKEEEVKYDNYSNRCFFGYQMDLSYSFGGLLPISFERNTEIFQILDNKKSFRDGHLKYLHEQNVCMRAILEGAVELYNKELEKQTGNKSFLTDLRTINQYRIEFLKAEKEFEEEKEKEMAPLRNFNQLVCSLNYYLEYRKKGLIPNTVEGIDIVETKDTIEVTNIIQGIPYCTMTVRKHNDMAHLKRFMIQTRTKKGRIGAPVEVGIYTKKYEEKDDAPGHLNEEQQGVFTSICKKVEKVIRPLNIEAYYKKLKMEEEQKEKQKQKSYKRKSSNRNHKRSNNYNSI